MPSTVEAEEIACRLRQSLRPGDRPSLLMTNLAVEYLSQSVPPGLGQLDVHFAASLTRKRRLSPCTLMLALVYVDRLRNYNPDYLHKVSSSDLFLVSMLVASKFMNDDGEEDEVFNDEWASSAHMKSREINKLEREFLAALDWQVFVSPETLSRILDRTESLLAYHKGLQNGWYSYTDLEMLSRYFPITDAFLFVLDRIIKMTIICVMTYTAGVLTVVASTSIVFRFINPFVISALQTRQMIASPTVTSDLGLVAIPDSENIILDLCPSSPNCTLPSSIQIPTDSSSNGIDLEQNCTLTFDWLFTERQFTNRKLNLHKISFFVIDRANGKSLFETRSAGSRSAVVDR